MEWFNRALARDPNRKVSWDKWPTFLGLAYLLAKIRYNRSNALTDPYDYMANDTANPGREPAAAKHYYTADGTWVSDNDNPQMGAVNTRFGSNIPPRKVRPDVENMTPSAREVGKLRWRRIDPETGKEIEIPALILNDLAGGWIQFQFHNFGGNTKRDPVSVCPHLLARDPRDGWPGNVAVVDRTRKDPTRVTDNGRPTVLNEREQAWIQGQIYGTNDAELAALRSFAGGKLKVDPDKRLPEDPAKPGVDKTGFSNNYNPLLSLLHWLFVSEHNAIACHFAYFHPDWDDEKLFQMARKTNCAQISRIHTVQWTEDLLQHPTLQLGMHADWYGLLGQRGKMYLMRLFDRHPWLSRMFTWLRHNELIWGMPGSKWEHHDGPFQVPLHFRMVYRLHEMVLSEREIVEPGTDRLLSRVGLREFIHSNTRPLVEKFGYETLAWSFVRKSCGALMLHNFPRALTQFENMQDGTLTDLAERDIFRERTDGTGSYNDFRASVGEPPVTSFLELTGGDAELARELEIKYEGDVNKVDAGIGILAEPKPAGFALGFCQFYQFVLNAPRRVKSNRHLTEGFTYQEYQEGMDWVEHAGGILGAMARHLPGLKPQMEGVSRGFAPWPEVETFPLRLLTKTHEDTARVVKADLRTLGLALVALVVAVTGGLFSVGSAVLLLLALAGSATALSFRRMLAMRFMQLCWKRCYTDKRGFMFGTLTRAEASLNSAAFFGRMQSLAITAGSLALCWSLYGTSPLLAAMFLLVALSSRATWKWSNAFAADAQLLKIALRNRMREGQPVVNAASLPGDTALSKRYWFLKGDNQKPVATFSSMYCALRRSGLPAWKSFGTALLSALSFGPKSQNGMSRELKALMGITNPFAVYIPNLVQAQSNSNTRIYAGVDNNKGLRPGDVDLEEFEHMFRTYAPGRDYLTAYDFARMHEGNVLRDAREGRGSWLSRFVGKMASKRRSDQLIMLFADRVVEEDKKLVPAVSREMMLRFYQGAAQYDLLREHEKGDLDPAPITSLGTLASLDGSRLARIYAVSPVGEIPDGESQGKAIMLPGTITGKLLSGIANLVWKGKVFDRANGCLVNKILGMRIVKAQVFHGESWKDGNQSIVIDYAKTSLLAFFIRDEIRQVQPGLYLGKAFIRLPFGWRFSALFFALDFRK